LKNDEKFQEGAMKISFIFMKTNWYSTLC